MFKRKNIFEKEITLPLFEPEKNEAVAQPQQVNYENTQQGHFYNGGEQNRAPQARIFEHNNRTPTTEVNPQPHLFTPETPVSYDSNEEEQVDARSMILPSEEPETTLGEGVSFNGNLTFQRLLRIDGHFEGELSSDGKLVVGPTGVVKSNIDLNEAIIEGIVEGDITVKERLELRGEAQVHGDIKASVLSVDEGVSIIGHVTIMPGDKMGLFDRKAADKKEVKPKKRKPRV